MIILWIRKAKKNKVKNNVKEDSETFQAHDEVMKKFRQAHPEPGIFSDENILTTDGNVLAPVHTVKLTDYIQN